jgi:pentose-5-phosphate-3-epimerase
MVGWYDCVVDAGARVLVAGAAVFQKGRNVSETMAELRASYGDVIL